MSKQRKTSYPLAIALSTLSTVFPIAGVLLMVYTVMAVSNHPDNLFMDIIFAGSGLLGGENELSPSLFSVIFFGIGILQWVALKRPLKKMYQQAILDNEYDEFGRSIKKSYDNLTRAEREEMDAQKTAQMEQLLSSSTLKKIVKKGSENPEEDLNNLIGLDSVKTKVTEMVARMKFEQSTQTGKKKTRSAYGMNGRHFVFYGSAGTGKTTVARIITGFLYKYGYIKENKCVEVDGNFLKAGELSDTKTKLLIQQAYGGVLFIDEAYTITEGGAYGEAVIATLIKEMEDNRDKFTAIFAGYKNDMKRLLLSNEGFSSRIKEYLEFADYSTEEMKQIFEAMAHSSGFVVSKEALDNFEVRCNRERDLPSFGNGRTARNILDEVIDKHALNYGNGALIRKEGDRMFTNEENKFVICGCDVSTNINKSVL